MKKPVLIILTNAFILLVILGLLAQSMFIVRRSARVESVQGTVNFQQGGQGDFTGLTAGQTVGTGDVVQTGSTGYAEFTWTDGTRWKVAPNSELLLKKTVSNTLQGSETSQFQLTAGKLTMRVPKHLSSKSRLEIQTPTALTSVRGTIFSVEADPGTTQVKVFKGRVAVSSSSDGREVMAEPGKEVTATATTISVGPDGGDAEFLAEPEFVKPSLEVDIDLPSGCNAVLRGQTEAGDRVAINGSPVKLLPNGAFVRRVQMAHGHNTWTIQSVDIHGGVTTVQKSYDFAGTYGAGG